MNGIYFIEKYYKNLYNSDSVKHAVRFHKNNTKFEDIRDYFNRLEDITIKAINSGKKDLLYNCFFSRHVIKKEDISNKYNDSKKEEIIKAQKDSLLPWLEYLNNPHNEEPYWLKYYIFQGMIKVGTYNEGKDKFMKRSSKTTSKFIEFNADVIDKLISYIKEYVYTSVKDEKMANLIQNNNFATLYYTLLKDYKNNLNNSQNGIWIKYNKNSKEDAYRLWQSIINKNTFWCTTDLQTCISQLCGGNTLEKYTAGDFYVYYTSDENGEMTIPRIAIRFDGDKIGEIRGVLDSSQNLEPSLTQVVKKKLDSFKSLTDLDKKFYLKAIDDNRKITKINQKCEKNISLSREELDFIYEINEYIYGFGSAEDSRINKIRSKYIINDEKYLYSASLRIENVLKYASVDLKNKKDLVIRILRKRYYLIDLVGEKLKDDKDFVLPILKKNPMYIRNLGNTIKKDPEIALLVLKYNVDLFRYMNINLLNNEDFVREASKIEGFTKKYLLKNNCDIIPKGDSNENK